MADSKQLLHVLEAIHHLNDSEGSREEEVCEFLSSNPRLRYQHGLKTQVLEALHQAVADGLATWHNSRYQLLVDMSPGNDRIFISLPSNSRKRVGFVDNIAGPRNRTPRGRQEVRAKRKSRSGSPARCCVCNRKMSRNPLPSIRKSKTSHNSDIDHRERIRRKSPNYKQAKRRDDVSIPLNSSSSSSSSRSPSPPLQDLSKKPSRSGPRSVNKRTHSSRPRVSRKQKRYGSVSKKNK